MIFYLLTHFQPFEIAAEIKTKCKIWLKCQFSHKTANHKKICNAPIDALICPLQIINRHWTPIVDHLGVNACFIQHLSNIENYLIRQKLINKKKKVHPSHIFLHLSADFWLKIQNTHHYRHWLTFLTSEQSALNSPVNGPAMTYPKIQNRLSRAL